VSSSSESEDSFLFLLRDEGEDRGTEGIAGGSAGVAFEAGRDFLPIFEGSRRW